MLNMSEPRIRLHRYYGATGCLARLRDNRGLNRGSAYVDTTHLRTGYGVAGGATSDADSTDEESCDKFSAKGAFSY